MDRIHMREVQVGDFVRHKHNPGQRYQVVAADGQKLIAVDTVEVRHAPEWEVWSRRDPEGTFKQLYK